MARWEIGLGLMLLSAPAYGHIELLEPTPRAYGASEGNLKTQPCGQTTNGRTDRVNVFRPGETIQVRWNETINHESYFRLAFEVDGDDFVQRPPENLAAASDDAVAEENAIDTGQLLAVVADTANGGEHATTVTLPNVECENCTLQLIQFMYGRADSYYYQCADIALRADAAQGTGGSANSGGSGGVNSGGAADATGGVLLASGGLLGVGGTTGIGGAEDPGQASGGSGATMGGGFGATGGATLSGEGGMGFETGDASGSPGSDAASCSCAAVGEAPARSTGLVLAMLLGAGLAWRRRGTGATAGASVLPGPLPCSPAPPSDSWSTIRPPLGSEASPNELEHSTAGRMASQPAADLKRIAAAFFLGARPSRALPVGILVMSPERSPSLALPRDAVSPGSAPEPNDRESRPRPPTQPSRKS